MQNKKRFVNGNRKALVAAICVVSALAVILITFLAAKNPIFHFVAEKKAENGEYSQALVTVGKSGGEKAEILEKYITLRLDISSSYPELLTEFNIEKIYGWQETAVFITEHSDLLSEKLSSEADLILSVLDGIVSGVTGYEAMRGDVLEMMDVFREVNRLHSKDADGKNIVFTVAEEKEKIRRWEQQCTALEQYTFGINGAEGIYLLNYLIKEVQGECTDINASMDVILQSGYTETDTVRSGGDGQKTYPDIRSSNNESVNFLEKENYELYVYKGICRVLTEALGEFYLPE